MIPPDGYLARGASWEDVAAIDRVFLDAEEALGVLVEPRAPYLRWLWSQPYVDLARDTRVVRAPTGVAAFAMGVHESSSPRVLRCVGRVRPYDLGRGLGAWMLGWFQERGKAQPGISVLRLSLPAEDRRGHDLISSAGFEPVRVSYDMGAELTGAETPGVPPPGVQLRPFVAGRDERAVWRVDTEAFRDHWDHELDMPYETFVAEWFGPGSGSQQVILAEAGGEVVGVCGWLVDTDAYVNSLAVLAPFRGHGIGTALLRAAIAAAAAAGHGRIALSVDASSPTGAVRVYEKVGMQVLRTTDIFERALA